MRAISVYPGQFRSGDVLALGRRFYEVEGHSPYMLGYERVMLHNLDETGSRGVYEFRQDRVVDVAAAAFGLKRSVLPLAALSRPRAGDRRVRVSRTTANGGVMLVQESHVNATEGWRLCDDATWPVDENHRP